MSIPFAKPDITEAEIALVVETLRTGILTNGPKGRAFEELLQQLLCPERYCVAVSSATAGLALILQAHGIRLGSEVIIPALTFTATAEAIQAVGAYPVMVDIDPLTLNLDMREVEVKVRSRRVAAIMPVHFAGLACSMPALLELAAAYDLVVIEDAAHALTSSYGGRAIGNWKGTTTVFSFYPNKPITTAEGGAIIVDSPEMAAAMKRRRLHGIAPASSSFSWDYEVVEEGSKCNMNELSAALGIGQLERMNRMQSRRSQIAAAYKRGFEFLPVVCPPEPKAGDHHSWHLYVIQLPGCCDRIAFIRKMSELGVGTSVHYRPLPLHPYWRTTYGLNPADFPDSLLYWKRCVSLPIYSSMTDQDVELVILAVQQSLIP